MQIIFSKIEPPYEDESLRIAYEKGYKDGERNTLRSILKSLKSSDRNEKSILDEEIPVRGEKE